jgi:hypothetical protein
MIAEPNLPTQDAAPEEDLEPYPEPVAESQLEIPIKKPRREVVYDVKRRVNKSIIYAGAVPHWRSFFFVCAAVCTWFLIISLVLILYFNYQKLPAQVPMIYQQIDQTWQTIPKEGLIAFPIVLSVFSIFVIYLNAKIYRFDRRLVLVMNIAIILADIFLLLGLSQLFSLLLVY